MPAFKKLKDILCCSGILFLAVLSAACGKSDETESRRPLRFAFQNRIGSAIPLVAIAQGYFKEEGLDLKPLQFTNGPACAETLFSGSADIATMGGSTALIALTQHSKLRLIASHGSGEHRHRLMVLKPVQTEEGLMGLRGKRVAVKKGTSTHGGFLALLAAKGIDPKSFTLVDLNPEIMPEALVAGSVDAIAASEPTPSMAESLGARELATFGGLGNSYPILILCNVSVLNERKEDLRLFFRALKRAENFVRVYPNETAGILSRATGLSLPVTRKAMERHQYRLCLDETVLSSLQSTARFLMDQKRLSVMPDFEKSVSAELLMKESIKPD